MEVEELYLYTKEHEWINLDDGEFATVGITEYAQSQLGDITFIELPNPGDEVEQFGELCSLESVKAASDIFSPMSGTIMEVNEDLNDSPEFINKDCYEKGWIARIRISDEDEKNNLMTAEEYQQFLISAG